MRVLQLEPLHTCNLTCTGCGRIREYSTSIKDMMSLEDCLGAADECNAPMISICGGEPMIYPGMGELVAKVAAAVLTDDRATRTTLVFGAGAAGLAAGYAAVPDVFARAIYAGKQEKVVNDKVLVMIQLAGGNDGLQTVIPLANSRYRDLRPQLRERVAAGTIMIKECVVEVAEKDRHRILDAIRRVNRCRIQSTL